MKSKIIPNASHACRFYFKKFSRKKYAAFNSMHRVVHIATLVISYSLIISPFKVCAQSDSLTFSKTIDLEEVEIVGEKSPALFTELPRVVSIITQAETESAPSQSISDLLMYTSNIDIRQRGKFGIQSDISIRGGSFDHNLILFNGINISDPQTGHLSLNLPVETDAINQVEILSGAATQVYGTNAFSGAINFITHPSNENSIKVSATAGSHYAFGSSVTINLAINKGRNIFHYNNGISDGYTKNTDFGKQGFYYQGQLYTEYGRFDIQFGHNTRSFGANGYYTPKYPDQFEKNQLTLFSMGYQTGKIIRVESKIYWRRNKDRFELFREDKNWYRLEGGMAISNDTNRTQYISIPWYSGHNHHISDALGAQLALNRSTKVGVSTLGWNIRSENIISTNVGYDKGIVIPVKDYKDIYYTRSDSRTNINIQFEQTINFKPLYIDAGILLNWNTFLPDEINILPGIDMRFNVSHFLQLTGSYNHSLGLPTFTDLTYEDPSNLGNHELKPYTKKSIEGGIRLLYGANITSVNAFYEYGEKIIDWVWFVDDNRFSPVNVDEYRNEGIELLSVHSFPGLSSFPFAFRKVRIGYIFMNMHKEIPGEVAKYFNLRHKLTGMIQQQILNDLVLTWNIAYQVREGNYLTYDFTENAYQIHEYEPYWLFNIRLSYSWRGFTAYFEATNLFNSNYIDIGSIYQPGRWITGGLKYEISGF
jgi:vitamin B12 transporter